MVKKIISLMLLAFMPIVFFAQKKISISNDTFVSLNFPTTIESAKISIPDLVDVQVSEDNVYLQYLTSATNEVSKEGNLLIKSVDGYYYSFLVDFATKPETLNYFIEVKDALRRVQPQDNSQKQKNSPISTNNSPLQSELLANAKIIADNGGYIKARNIIFQKKMELIHRGIYHENKKMYFLFYLNNRSNIPYNVESYKFEIVGTNDNDGGVSQTILPLEIYNKLSLIPSKTDNKIVFIFDQFTISDGKKLVLTINEKKGDRSLIYDIDPKIFASTLQLSKIKK